MLTDSRKYEQTMGCVCYLKVIINTDLLTVYRFFTFSLDLVLVTGGGFEPPISGYEPDEIMTTQPVAIPAHWEYMNTTSRSDILSWQW